LPESQIELHVPKNIITRSLGPYPSVQVDLEGPFPLEVGDTFLLCSDGLSGQLKDEELGALLSALSPSEAVRVLIDVANLRGGPDNITAIVARVEAVPTAEVAEAVSTTAPHAGPTVNPVWWGVMALCLLIGLVLAVSHYYVAALVSVLVGVASAVAALVQGLSGPAPGESLVDQGVLGSGPHASFDCTPNAASVTAASQLATQLREATRNEHWTLDWGHFNTLGQQAQAALDAGNFREAVRDYALSISFMMNEIRSQAAKKDHRDSSVLDT
jgi:protein phosphatase